MKMTLVFLLVFIFVVSAKSQTYIGQTKKEILSEKKKSGNHLDVSKKKEKNLSTLVYEDHRFPIAHNFYFTRNNKCVLYMMVSASLAVKDSIEKNLNNKFPEKISAHSWIQKSGDKRLVWSLRGEDHLYVFSTELEK